MITKASLESAIERALSSLGKRAVRIGATAMDTPKITGLAAGLTTEAFGLMLALHNAYRMLEDKKIEPSLDRLAMHIAEDPFYAFMLTAVPALIGAGAGVISYAGQSLSTRDQLTGLYNRRCLDRTLGSSVLGAKKTNGNGKGAYLSGDLDHFKTINDTYGHQEGDAVLKEVALAIEFSIRGVDQAYRLGGDEFGILLYAANADGAAAVKERVNNELEARLKRRYGWDEERRGYVLSRGAHQPQKQSIPFLPVFSWGTVILEEARTPRDILRLADLRLYEEKRRHHAEHPDLSR